MVQAHQGCEKHQENSRKEFSAFAKKIIFYFSSLSHFSFLPLPPLSPRQRGPPRLRYPGRLWLCSNGMHSKPYPLRRMNRDFWQLFLFRLYWAGSNGELGSPLSFRWRDFRTFWLGRPIKTTNKSLLKNPSPQSESDIVTQYHRHLAPWCKTDHLHN